MKLLVTMHERVSRVVCNKIDSDGVEWHYVDDVFHQAAHPFVSNARHLKAMTMKMYGMLISARIAEQHAITPSLQHLERLDLGPRISIDRPGIELRSVKCAGIAEGQSERLFGLGHWVIKTKLCVVPIGRSHIFPRRSACAAGILHHDAQPHLPALFKRRPQHPHPRVVHLNDRIDSLSNRERQNLDRFWRRDWIAIHCNDLESMSR